MILGKTLKYPVLMVGIIMFAIFITDEKTAKWWDKSKRRFIPSNCDSLLTRIADKAPKEWEMECPGTELLLLRYKFDKSYESKSALRTDMYKQVANIFVTFSQIANPETLERLKIFKIVMESPTLHILAQTDGEAMVGFRTMKSKEKIANHLKLTVKVKEEFK